MPGLGCLRPAQQQAVSFTTLADAVMCCRWFPIAFCLLLPDAHLSPDSCAHAVHGGPRQHSPTDGTWFPCTVRQPGVPSLCQHHHGSCDRCCGGVAGLEVVGPPAVLRGARKHSARQAAQQGCRPWAPVGTACDWCKARPLGCGGAEAQVFDAGGSARMSVPQLTCVASC